MADTKLEKRIPTEETEDAALLQDEETSADEATEPEEAQEEKNTPEDGDEALSSFLSRDPAKVKPAKLTQSRKTLFIFLGVVLAIAALVLTLFLLRRTHGKEKVEEDLLPAEFTLSVTDGVHEAEVTLDGSGKIKKNGYGSLLTYNPADISEIAIENEGGSFKIVSHTPEGENTVYKLVGLEDYDLQGDTADAIASHASSLDFTKIITADGNPADYGLDEPRAKVAVTYQDGTTAIILVGNDAAGGAGTYVSFGTGKAVYLVNTDSVRDFFYSAAGLIDTSITESAEESGNTSFTTLTISGTHFSEPITLEANNDEAVNATYLITSPCRVIADENESHNIEGNIRGLFAETVLCVNPSKDQLKKYGLSKPYASIKAVYPDAVVTLHASAPADNGIVHVYNPDKKVIYDIQLAAVCWAKTGLDLLMPENPLNSRAAFIDAIDFSAGDTAFTLDVSSSTETIIDEDGNEQEVTDTSATCRGKKLDDTNFHVFFQNLNNIKNIGYSDAAGGEKVMSVTYRYTTGRDADTLVVYGSADNTYFLELNGDRIGTASKSYITKLIKGANNLIKGETVEGL